MSESTVPTPDPQLYVRVVENIDRAVIALDRDGRIILINAAAQHLTGLSERQALQRPFATLFRGQDALLSLIGAALREGRSVSDQENILLRRPGGTQLPASASASPLFSDAGQQEGAVIILRDLSRLRELEEAVRRADQLAVAGAMAAGLAHEIKNPLGGIRGAAQLLGLELTAQPELKEYIDVMIREVERINGLIEELMDLATPRTSRFSAVQVTSLLNDIVLLQREAFRDQGIEFQLDVDPSIPPLLGDEALLTRLFLNLVKNAAEAIDGPGRVTIISRISSNLHLQHAGSKAVPMLQVEIRDTGRGIEPEALERIFAPFYTTKERGTGLGLAICQKVVLEHRGLIKIDSTPGQGTHITVNLPLFR